MGKGIFLKQTKKNHERAPVMLRGGIIGFGRKNLSPMGASGALPANWPGWPEESLEEYLN